MSEYYLKLFAAGQLRVYVIMEAYERKVVFLNKN
jgi:hypothetical protein